MDREQPELTTFVVVNFNAGQHLADCVDSVLAQSASGDAPLVELVVVDNGSADGSLEHCAQQLKDPRARVIRNPDNRGYAAACNQGAADFAGDLICLLNPDSVLPIDALTQVRRWMGAEDGPALAGVNVVDDTGAPMRATWRRLPTPWRALITFSGLERLGLTGVNIAPLAEPPEVLEREAVSGACLFLTRQAWQELSGLDEGFFLHCEDLDLFKRASEAGLKLVLFPHLDVVHHQGVSSRPRPLRVAFHKHLGMMRYFRKHSVAHGLNPMVWLVNLAIGLRFLLLTPMLAFRGLRMRRRAAV